MKILEQPSKLDDGWWIGKRHRCDMCGTVVELEKGDTVIVNVGRGVTFDCPTCNMPCYMPTNQGTVWLGATPAITQERIDEARKQG